MKLQRPKWSSSWFHAIVIWKSDFSRHSFNRQQAVPFKKNLRLAGASRTLPETVRVEPSLKLTVCPWKSTVRKCNFFPGWPIFMGKPLLSGNVIRANKTRTSATLWTLGKLDRQFAKLLKSWFKKQHLFSKSICSVTTYQVTQMKQPSNGSSPWKKGSKNPGGSPRELSRNFTVQQNTFWNFKTSMDTKNPHYWKNIPLPNYHF